MLLFIVLVGAFAGSTFLFVGSGVLAWIVLLLVTMPIIVAVLELRLVCRSRGWKQVWTNYPASRHPFEVEREVKL